MPRRAPGEIVILLFHSAKLSKGSLKIRFNYRKRRFRHGVPRDDYEVQETTGRRRPLRRPHPENLTNPTLCAVSDDGPAHFAGRNDAEPIPAQDIWGRHQRKEAGRNAAPAALHAIELISRSEPCRATKLHRHSAGRPPEPGCQDVETVSRFRPFARRRFSTMRPFLVLMRTRNPWVRRRRRRLGWNVRFMRLPVGCQGTPEKHSS